MKPVSRLLLRAMFVGLLLLSLGANVARADDTQLSLGDGSTQTLPEDPGLEY